jgi:membrane protease YdiL (CAAX protease family)
MTASVLGWISLLSLIVLAGGYGFAFRDWVRADHVRLLPGSPPARVWAAAAVLLVLLMAWLRAVAFGLTEGVRFLFSGEGGVLLVRAAGVVFLIQAGRIWAERVGARPLRPERRRWRRWPWRWLAASLAGMIGWTLLLAHFVPHRERGDNLMRWLRLDEMDVWLQAPTAIALLTLAPIVEECFFRHYLLYRITAWLGRERPGPEWMVNAIIVTSILFAMAHLGHIEPFWFKWAQIFVPGLILGTTSWKHGLEAAIALHWSFNIALFGVMLATQ